MRPRAAVLAEKAFEALIRLSGVSAILFVAAIFFFVLREAAPVLFSEGFSLVQFLFSTEWYPTSATNVRYGTFALTVGTLSVTALAMVLAVPFGLGAAIFLSEFCSPRVRETLKVVIELLSAIPSVVWGFVGLTVMSKLIVSSTGAPVGVNVLNGGIILALMSVPVIVSIGEDALKAVPVINTSIDGDNIVYKKLDLVVERGEKIALVGPNQRAVTVKVDEASRVAPGNRVDVVLLLDTGDWGKYPLAKILLADMEVLDTDKRQRITLAATAQEAMDLTWFTARGTAAERMSLLVPLRNSTQLRNS